MIASFDVSHGDGDDGAGKGDRMGHSILPRRAQGWSTNWSPCSFRINLSTKKTVPLACGAWARQGLDKGGQGGYVQYGALRRHRVQ